MFRDYARRQISIMIAQYYLTRGIALTTRYSAMIYVCTCAYHEDSLLFLFADFDFVPTIILYVKK